MRKAIKIFFLLHLLVYVVVTIADDNITLTNVQLYNLGIKLGKLEQVKQIPLLYAPAKVVIPPAHEYIISAAQAGLIRKLYVAVGDSVAQGQVLAEINSPELLTLQRQYLKANSERNLALAVFQREKKLLDEGIISDRRWQETRTRYAGKVASVNEAQQLLEIAGMSTDDIKRLARTRRLSSLLEIYSPIVGVVLERMVVAGKRIDILEPLYRIANLDQLWLEINIPQERVNILKLGDRVNVVNTQIKAHIILLGQSVNPNNQTVLVRAIIDNKDSSVRAGQTVNSQIIQSSDKPVFKLANAGIALNDGEAFVFSRSEQGFLVKQVKVIGKEGGSSFITGNLQSGEELAIRGAVALKAKWLGLGEGGNE
jgi:membrane fusion protein, heavy metal efflux system